MHLVQFTKLTENREKPRLWLEGQRLNRLGFTPGTAFNVDYGHDRITLKRSILRANNHVSSRQACGGKRPIIDLNSVRLEELSKYDEIRIKASHGIIDIQPSVRAFHIARNLSHSGALDTIELFCGGGTLSQALPEGFRLIMGAEINPDYSDVWASAHPEATLLSGDIRLMHPSEFPDFQVLVAGIPCTSHSLMGRSKKSLAGKPELGDTGDLFLPVLNLIAHKMPLAVVLENVPQFGTSLAGQLIADHLRKLSYHVTETVIEPHAEWSEPSDRRRWVLVATLEPGFEIRSPGTQFSGRSGDLLDSADAERDAEDCKRIERTIAGLRVHNQRHREAGHGFEFTTLTGEETKIPVIPKSYHKINTGPFVQTEHGLRLLRKHEIERIMGAKVDCEHYSTAVQILGQGVQPRVFRSIFEQLRDFFNS